MANALALDPALPGARVGADLATYHLAMEAATAAGLPEAALAVLERLRAANATAPRGGGASSGASGGAVVTPAPAPSLQQPRRSDWRWRPLQLAGLSNEEGPSCLSCTAMAFALGPDDFLASAHSRVTWF